MPSTLFDVESGEIHNQIKKLIDNLINTKDETGEFLLRLKDGRVIDTKGWNDWEWTHGIGLYGLWNYHSLVGDEATLSIILKWYKDRFDQGTTTKNINTMAVFLTLACIYETDPTKYHVFYTYLDVWAEWAMYQLDRTEYGGMQHVTYTTKHHNQLWDDTLMMTVLPLAKIGVVLNRPHYVNEAKKQFLTHIRYLGDRQTGLFYHGWSFENGGHNYANALWARGNSWVTIAIPEIIEILDLQPGDPIREFLVDTLNAQVSAIAKLQGEDGRWHTLLNDPTSYLESSASAGFAFGILKSVRKRYVSDSYLPVGVKAVKGILKKIDEKGELLETSFGTGMGKDLEFYKKIALTSMPYGQALAMMALGEFLHLYV
jgi:unsaturated rhamnogalacturonyl hydrolase